MFVKHLQLHQQIMLSVYATSKKQTVYAWVRMYIDLTTVSTMLKQNRVEAKFINICSKKKAGMWAVSVVDTKLNRNCHGKFSSSFTEFVLKSSITVWLDWEVKLDRQSKWLLCNCVMKKYHNPVFDHNPMTYHKENLSSGNSFGSEKLTFLLDSYIKLLNMLTSTAQ